MTAKVLPCLRQSFLSPHPRHRTWGVEIVEPVIKADAERRIEVVGMRLSQCAAR